MTPLVSVLTGRGLTLLGYNPQLESNIVGGINKGDKSNQPRPPPSLFPLKSIVKPCEDQSTPFSRRM